MSGLIPPLEFLFPAASRGVLSLVGAGGKTSLMFHLAHLLSEAGQRVLTTTTTKIYDPAPEQSGAVLVASDPQAILSEAVAWPGKSGHITAAQARMDAEGKLQGFAPEAIDLFAASGLFDWILVEADGAARRPLKAPAAHEPVIPASSDIVIAVAGLDALANPLNATGVFRADLVADRMGLKIGENVTESALCRLISHPLGLFKGAPEKSLRVLFLNKADTQERREAAARIAIVLESDSPAAADVLLIGQARESLIIHAVYPLKALNER